MIPELLKTVVRVEVHMNKLIIRPRVVDVCVCVRACVFERVSLLCYCQPKACKQEIPGHVKAD